MVNPKIPPCSQYGENNYLYHRNKKLFCRKGNPSKKNGPRVPPCDKYGDNYIEYTRKSKKYCRKGRRKD